MRLYVGAGLSMLDLATDIDMVMVYMREGQVGAASSLLVMISACLLIQLTFVYFQGSRRVMVKEVLIALSGTKPGVDAMRVASDTEKNEHNVFDPASELAGSRAIELFCESIPRCILQFTAAVRVRQGGGPASNIAMGSIVISALTAGYSRTCISVDFEAQPRARHLRKSSEERIERAQTYYYTTFLTKRCREQRPSAV